MYYKIVVELFPGSVFVCVFGNVENMEIVDVFG
jgi:hypothetical protein